MDRTKLRVQNKPLHLWSIDFQKKVLRKIQLGRISSINCSGTTFIVKGNNTNLSHTVHKINSTQIIGLNVRAKILKLPEGEEDKTITTLGW